MLCMDGMRYVWKKTPLVKNRECVLIKHIIPTGLKLIIINPLFVDVSFGCIYV